MEERYMDLIDTIGDRIIETRRDFHKHAEAGWLEFRTASLVARRLKTLGFEVDLGESVISREDRMGLPTEEELAFHYERALAQGADEVFVESLKGGFTGVVGTLELGEGPTVALRFDMDANRLVEGQSEEHLPNQLKFSSANEGVMHACGHDGHTAIGLGVAEVISKIGLELKGIGRLKLIFQPAEEGVRGAKAMVQAGVLDDVDYVMACHLMSNKRFGTSGDVVCGINGFMATTKLDVRFKGTASHAGFAPNEGNNALLAACTATLNMNAIPRHTSGASRVNVGVLEGGTDRNVIADESYLKLETRGQSTVINDYVRAYAIRIIESSAQMHGADYEVEFMGEAATAECDEALVKRVKRVAEGLECFDHVIESESMAGGCDDFTYMMESVQRNGGEACYFAVATEFKAGHHHPLFDISDPDLIRAVKLFTGILLDLNEERKG